MTPKQEYDYYLSTPQWQTLRAKVAKRSAGICERCLCYEAGEVHHKTYERKFHERLSDLLHVCDRCHSFLHGFSATDPAIKVSDGRKLAVRVIQLVAKDKQWREVHADCPVSEVQRAAEAFADAARKVLLAYQNQDVAYWN